MGIMKIQISAPSIAFDLPEGWALEETVDAWAVAVPADYDPELAATFLPNVAFMIIRVESDTSIEELAEDTLDAINESYTDVVVREQFFGEGIMDRSVTFTAEELHMFQYQRNMLLSSFSDDVHWFVQIHATAPIEHEESLQEAFRQILISAEISPGA